MTLFGSLNGSIEEIYRQYRRQLFTCALAITRCPDRAEDAIQEAFYRLFRLGSKPRYLKAYAFRAVRNAAIDQLRTRPVAEEDVDEYIFDPATGPRDLAMEKEAAQAIARALLALSDNERETIVQHIYGELTFREIAEIREAPPGTVAAWYQRGLEKLRTLLEKEP